MKTINNAKTYYKYEFENLSGGLIKSVSREISSPDPEMARRMIQRDYPFLRFDTLPCTQRRAIMDGELIIGWEFWEPSIKEE